MRPVALVLACLLAWMSAAAAQIEDSDVCSGANRAVANTLPAVVQACTRAAREQATAADGAKMLRNRGIALARSGDLSAAIADFDKVLQAVTNDMAALQARAQTFEALGQEAQAAADYERLAALQPGDTRWRTKVAALGGAASVANPTQPQPLVQTQPPLAPAASLVTATPASPTPLVPAPQVVAQTVSTRGTKGLTITGNEGVVCASALQAAPDTLPTVIQACSKIQAKQPSEVDRARVFRYRGIAHQRSGDPQAAIADFDQVLQRTPDDTWALQGRAESLEAVGQRQQAIQDYGRLAALRPGDTRWRVKIAQLGATPPTPAAPAAPTAPATIEPPVVAAAPTPPTSQVPAQTAAAEAPAAQSPEELIRKVQAALRELGYDVGAVNGRVGDKMRQAMDRFAGDFGLPRGNQPDEALLGAVAEQVRYRREMAAEEQKALNIRAQKALLDLGYDIGDVDGAIGPRSRSALQAWSSIRGKPESEVNEQVVASLEEAVVERLVAPPPTAPATVTPPTPPIVAKVKPPAPAPVTAPAIPAPILDLAAIPSEATPEVPVVATPTAATRTAGGYDLIAPGAEAPEKRVALVIGNADYQTVTPLVNPKNDAGDMAAALSDLGFEVLRGVDLSRESMTRITKDFARKARTADIAMAYYSGHGMQFENTNYLIPVDGQIQDEYDLREMVQLDQVIQDTGQAKKLSLVVVDACRDDPLAAKALTKSLGKSRSTSLGQGLAIPRLPQTSQSLIAYATAAGNVAYDGAEQARNSPFTAALLKYIKTPKLDVRGLFGKVADEVWVATANQQRPDKWDSLGGDPIYLLPGPPEPVGLEMTDLTQGEVLVVQRSLKWLKYWAGAEDGVATPELTPAVRSWQRTLGAEQSGRLIPQQLIALNRMAARDRPRQPLPEFTLNEIVGRAFGGDVEAQRVMGMIYDPAFADAPGFTKDRSTAQNFYQKAASQGDVQAAGLLGTMLVAGENPAPDRNTGMQWLETAAKSGDSISALRLAEIVVERQADASGRAKAVQFLKIAAADPGTNGMANAWLRYVGQPVTQ